MIKLTRYCPSGHNLQPLRYIPVIKTDACDVIRMNIGWAGGLKGGGEWRRPQQGKCPPAYIVVLQDLYLRKTGTVDHGIAALTILLSAAEKGLGGCMFTSINKKPLIDYFKIQEKYKILMVIALGKPKEMVIIDDATPSDDLIYWRDKDGNNHVPMLKSEYYIIDES